MAISPQDLPEREKEVLRLLLAGHDAKSIGRTLGLSTNVVNERLRDSRRKLDVTSSREAARLLALAESESPNKFGNKQIGIEGSQTIRTSSLDSGATSPRGKNDRFIVKGLMMTTISAILLAGAAIYSSMSVAPAATPTVIYTYPADGSAIAVGPYVLTVTYDQPMVTGSFSFVQVGKDSYPACDGRPKQTADKRSFTMACVAKPGGRYEIWFNRGRFTNFKSQVGLIPAMPKRLTFKTK